MMTFVGSEEEVKLAEYKYQVEYKLFENKNWLNLQGGGRYFHITKEGIRKGMETAKKTRAKPGWTEKRSNATKLAWANPENRKKQTEAIRKARLGSMHTPAAKQKMSLSQKQNPRIWTDSMRESARARMTAREPLNKEQLERIAEKLRRRKRPDEVKKKISEKLTGRVLTEEQKMKIRLKSVKSNFNKFTRYLLDHQIYTSTEWKIHLKNHTIPDYIPRRPDKFYPNRGDDFSWTMWKKINPSST